MKQSATARFTTAAVIAVFFCSAPAASAVAPGGPPNDIFYELPAGTACANFDLRLEGTGSQASIREFKDANGEVVRRITAGKGYTVTYTNLKNGKSLVFKPNGSVQHESIDKGITTVTATGHNGLVMFPTDTPAGPTTIHYTGRIVYTVDGGQNFTLKSTSGTKVDVCAALK